jgi:hypothetical protein
MLRRNTQYARETTADGSVPGLSGHDQPQHFMASPAWDDTPLWWVLAARADRLVGEPRAALVIDDKSNSDRLRSSQVGIVQGSAKLPSHSRIPVEREHHLEAAHSSWPAAVGILLSPIQQPHHAPLHLARRCSWDMDFVVRQPLRVRIHGECAEGREIPMPSEPPAHQRRPERRGSGRELLLYRRGRRPWQSSYAFPSPHLPSCCTAT